LYNELFKSLQKTREIQIQISRHRARRRRSNNRTNLRPCKPLTIHNFASIPKQTNQTMGKVSKNKKVSPEGLKEVLYLHCTNPVLGECAGKVSKRRFDSLDKETKNKEKPVSKSTISDWMNKKLKVVDAGQDPTAENARVLTLNDLKKAWQDANDNVVKDDSDDEAKASRERLQGEIEDLIFELIDQKAKTKKGVMEKLFQLNTSTLTQQQENHLVQLCKILSNCGYGLDRDGV
jgi:hypothetical protein